MLFKIYSNYFAKDKPLRHYTQHFLVALFGIFLLMKFGVNITASRLIWFIFFSYIVDVDGVISVFVFRKKIKEAGDIVKALTSYKFIESATLATIHHKKLNRLLLHNIIGFIFLIAAFLIALTSGLETYVVVLWAIICHFVFDVTDDVYQLGHINNWLWPIKVFNKSLKQTS